MFSRLSSHRIGVTVNTRTLLIVKLQADITRTKEEALRIISGYEARIKNGEKLKDLARSESDCSSARKEGDLGFFGRGDMQKEFEEAAFRLKPGEVSGVVETASGLHLIQRQVSPTPNQLLDNLLLIHIQDID